MASSSQEPTQQTDVRPPEHTVRKGRFKTMWDWKQLEYQYQIPPGDYRDQLPPPMEVVAADHAPIVQDGQWTLGIFEMWGKKGKHIKAAVHVPCCPSFRFNPLKWRGICFGRNLHECYWYGCDRTRWARLVYAAGLGREYKYPFLGLGRGYQDEVCTLCWFNYCFGIVASLGIGQAISICGNFGANFSSCYSCHAREKLRRKYSLPATFGLPPGIDDCCVHFMCMYCASHQEMRELAVRGIDGPGLHVLDVYPQAWAHLPGIEEAIAARKNRLQELEDVGDLFEDFDKRIARDARGLAERLRTKNAATQKQTFKKNVKSALVTIGGVPPTLAASVGFIKKQGVEARAAATQVVPPLVPTMVKHDEVPAAAEVEPAPVKKTLTKAYSIAY